jgi:hypothetical protein
LDRDLHSLDSSDTVQLSDSEIAEIAEMRARKVAMLETSEQLRLPWKEGNEGKAGEWAEYHLFGGLVTLNSQKRGMYIPLYLAVC